jgi:hypothetical protein
MFIEKINFKVDLDKMILDLSKIESDIGWPDYFESNGRAYHANQIGLTYRPKAEYPWNDASGSLYDKELKHFVGKESDFTEWNSVGDYTRQVIEELSDCLKTNFGRIRYMKLMPKSGLSVHSDFEIRYHLVLKTNPYSYFGEEVNDQDISAKCYHIPADSHFYKVDTLKNHFVFNGGWEPRIHLVLTESK